MIERAVILCDNETFSIDETWLKLESPPPSGPVAPLAATLIEREKQMIEAALAQCQGRVSGVNGAAKKLGILRQTLDARIASLRIDVKRYRAGPPRFSSYLYTGTGPPQPLTGLSVYRTS